MFRALISPSSVTLVCAYSLWYNAPTMLPAGSLEAEELRFQATGRDCNGCIIPQAVTQYSAPEDGRNNRRKLVELSGIISKLLLLHLVGCTYYFFPIVVDLVYISYLYVLDVGRKLVWRVIILCERSERGGDLPHTALRIIT